MTYADARRLRLVNMGKLYGHVMPLPGRIDLLRGREQYRKGFK